MLKAIIFDLDDTLLKTRETKFAALKFAGKHFYNIAINDETLNLHWGKPFLEFMGIVFGNVDSPENISKNYKSIVQSNISSELYELLYNYEQKLRCIYKESGLQMRLQDDARKALK